MALLTLPLMMLVPNAGDITKWTYVADTSRPAVSQSHTPIQPLARVTLQAGQRNKFNLSGSSTASPETSSCSKGEFQRVQQATWTMTTTSRLRTRFTPETTATCSPEALPTPHHALRHE